jgi:hypothetical protein
LASPLELQGVKCTYRELTPGSGATLIPVHRREFGRDRHKNSSTSAHPAYRLAVCEKNEPVEDPIGHETLRAQKFFGFPEISPLLHLVS